MTDKAWEPRVQIARYWNANGQQQMFVGVANFAHGILFDWAVYVGSGPAEMDKDELQHWVEQYGCKVDRDLGKHLCPGYSIRKYR